MAATTSALDDRPVVSKVLDAETTVTVPEGTQRVAHLPGACGVDYVDVQERPAGEVDIPLCVNCARAAGIDPATGDPLPKRGDVDRLLRRGRGQVHRVHPDAPADDPYPACVDLITHGREKDWPEKTPRQMVFADTCSQCFNTEDADD